MPQVKTIPDGMHSVTPHLVCAGAVDAIEFYKKAFNAVEVGRMAGPQGKFVHASIRIAGSAVMLGNEVRQFFELQDFRPSESVDRFREMGVGTQK